MLALALKICYCFIHQTKEASMCMFSGSVREVSRTCIFAREGEEAAQYIVYEMSLAAPKEVAMVLPIPVDQTKAEAGLKFINLAEFAGFFTQLNGGFEIQRVNLGSMSMSRGYVPVQQVGAFEASFVPKFDDFSRLDPRFRLPEKVWDQLSHYKNFGFAVFKLRKGELRYHPMAFSFERSELAMDRLFFPTVHVHDEKVHKRAKFDHMLYCQARGTELNLQGWTESRGAASQFMSVKTAQGIIDADQHCYRKLFKGEMDNRDIFVMKV
jgi:hypothetical protein